jgi:hypothetical protein
MAWDWRDRTIEELIRQFKYEKLVIHNNNIEHSFFVELGDALLRGVSGDKFKTQDGKVEWQVELEEVTDYYWAMLTFYEMTTNRVMTDKCAILAFYYASKVLMELKLEHKHKDAYCVRSMSIFCRLSIFVSYSKWVYPYYKGDLNENQFFDIFLLGNVYMSQGSSLTFETVFQKIQKQTPSVALKYQSLSREKVIEEGLKASKAYYDYISECLSNPYFTSPLLR